MMKKLQRLIEYFALVVFAAIIRLFSIESARKAAVALADFTFNTVKIRRDVVIQNLTLSFPEKKMAEIEQIAQNTYRQFATTMMELLFFPKWTREDIAKMVIVEGKEVLDNALKQGKGAVLVSGHFCNWELLGACIAYDYPLNFVIGRQENSKVDVLLNSYREGKNFKMIPMKVALRGVMQALKKNELVAMVADQDAHEIGTFVNFFGRPASTPKGPSVFTLRADCPMIYSVITRESAGGLKAKFILVPKPVPTGDEEKDIQNYTQAFTAMLENYTRQYPDHWFWLHKRWKTKPK
jgi:KDO2-lipid IV(A) lauroyltransferase